MFLGFLWKAERQDMVSVIAEVNLLDKSQLVSDYQGTYNKGHGERKLENHQYFTHGI
jgi:hypothetical protein